MVKLNEGYPFLVWQYKFLYSNAEIIEGGETLTSDYVITGIGKYNTIKSDYEIYKLTFQKEITSNAYIKKLATQTLDSNAYIKQTIRYFYSDAVITVPECRPDFDYSPAGIIYPWAYQGQLFTFTDLSTPQETILSRGWEYSRDGGNWVEFSTDKNPTSYLSEVVGTYSIRLTITNTEGSFTNAKTDIIKITDGKPAVAFDYTPFGGDPGQIFDFTDSSNAHNDPISDWKWEYSKDGGALTQFSILQNPSSDLDQAIGMYSIKLSATNEYGTGTLTKTDIIEIIDTAPTCDFTYTPSSGTQGSTFFDFNYTGERGVSFSWQYNNGDGWVEFSTDRFVDNYRIPVYGLMSIKCIATNSKGSATETKTDIITIASGVPVADFSWNPDAGASGQEFVFTNLSTNMSGEFSPITYKWEYSKDGGGWIEFSTSASPTDLLGNSEGTYSIKLSITNEYGDDSITKTDIITISDTLPIADFSYTPSEAPQGTYFDFTDLSSGGVTNWKWEYRIYSPTGLGAWTEFSTDQNPSSRLDDTIGDLDIKLTVTNVAGSTSITKSKIITISSGIPIADFVYDPTQGFPGVVFRFRDTTTNTPTSWKWEYDLGDGWTEFSTLQNVDEDFGSTLGWYSIRLTSTNEFGSTTNSKYYILIIFNTITKTIFQDAVLARIGLAYLISPANTSTVSGRPVRYTYWVPETMIGRVHGRIQLASDAGFSNLLYDETNYLGSGNSTWEYSLDNGATWVSYPDTGITSDDGIQQIQARVTYAVSTPSLAGKIYWRVRGEVKCPL